MVRREAMNPANALFALLCFCVIGFSVTIIIIVRNELWWRTRTCVKYQPGTTTCIYQSGCMIGTDPGDDSLCRYAYSVGSIGMFNNILAFICLNAESAVGITFFTAVFNIAWWAVAGGVFTDAYEDGKNLDPPLPEGHFRHVLMALCWTSMSLGAVQMLIALWRCYGLRKGGAYAARPPADGEAQYEQQRQQELAAAHAYAAPPPPAPAYYPPPATGYAVPLPQQAPGDYGPPPPAYYAPPPPAYGAPPPGAPGGYPPPPAGPYGYGTPPPASGSYGLGPGAPPPPAPNA